MNQPHPQSSKINQPLSGRNANIQPNMFFKRKQIFEKTTTQRFQTPFSGYSFTGSTVNDNSLSRSQVSDFSQQEVKKLIKQQLQRNSFNNISQNSDDTMKYKTQMNILKTQLRCVKESYHQLNKFFKKKFDQQNQTILQIKQQFTSPIKDQSFDKTEICFLIEQKTKLVEQDIITKMKLFVTKIQQNLKKDLINYSNKQFVPIKFIQDLDSQLDDFEIRIQNLQKQNKTPSSTQNQKTIKIQKDQSTKILSSTLQHKLTKIQRDFQSIKKTLDQKSIKIKELDSIISNGKQYSQLELKQVKQSIVDIRLSLKEQSKEIASHKQGLDIKVKLMEKSLQGKIQNDIEALRQNIDEKILQAVSISNITTIQSKIITSSKAISSNEQAQKKSLSPVTVKPPTNKYEHPSIPSSQSPSHHIRKSIQKLNNLPKVKILYANKKQPLSQPTQLPQQNPVVQSPPKHPPKQSLTNQIPKANKTETILAQRQQKVETIYKIDINGYLMDSNDKYILKSNNQMIKITQEQIRNIQQAGGVRIQRVLPG